MNYCSASLPQFYSIFVLAQQQMGLRHPGLFHQRFLCISTGMQLHMLSMWVCELGSGISVWYKWYKFGVSCRLQAEEKTELVWSLWDTPNVPTQKTHTLCPASPCPSALLQITRIKQLKKIIIIELHLSWVHNIAWYFNVKSSLNTFKTWYASPPENLGPVKGRHKAVLTCQMQVNLINQSLS